MGSSNPELVMVAERAVEQGLLDLRGELGVKFKEVDDGLKDLQNFRIEMDENFENLSDSMTAAFKNNNALLRGEMRALAGDIAQQAQNAANKSATATEAQNESLKKQIFELEKNINITLANTREDLDRVESKANNKLMNK